MTSSSALREYDLLRLFVDEMEARGLNKNLIRMSVDEAFAVRISEKVGVKCELDELHRITDRCLANEWLTHGAMGSKYGHLVLTTAGFGVVRSLERRDEMRNSRSTLKRISDFIEEHRGLLLALGALAAVTTVLLRFA